MMGVYAALSCAFFYALSYCFLRRGQKSVSPPDHGLFPILSTSVISLGIVNLFVNLHAQTNTRIAPTTWHVAPLLYALLSGAIATCFGRLLLYAGIEKLGATRGVVIKGISPFITLAVVVVFFRQTVRLGDAWGLIAIVLAMGFLWLERVRARDVRGGSDTRWYRSGIALAVASAVVQGLGHTFRQLSIDQGISAPAAALADVTAALVIYVLFLWFSGQLVSLFAWYKSHRTPDLTYAGFFSSVAVLLFFLSIHMIPVSTVSILVATEPIFVALLSATVFSRLEQVTWYSAAAAITVAVGVVLLSL